MRAIRETRGLATVLVAELRTDRSAMRIVSGGGDTDSTAATIIDLIMDRGLCDDCLVRKTGLPRERVAAVVSALARHYVTTRADESCDECLQHRVVRRLGEPDRSDGSSEPRR